MNIQNISVHPYVMVKPKCSHYIHSPVSYKEEVINNCILSYNGPRTVDLSALYTCVYYRKYMMPKKEQNNIYTIEKLYTFPDPYRKFTVHVLFPNV